MNRWRVLTEVDKEIAAASAEVRTLGEEYERLLAEKYTTLNDKNYLSSLLDVVKATAAADAEVRAANPEMVIESGEINGRRYERLASGKYRCWAKSSGKVVYFGNKDLVEAFLYNT